MSGDSGPFVWMNIIDTPKGGIPISKVGCKLRHPQKLKVQMGVSKNRGNSKSSILIGFSTFSFVFTIHFGGVPPIFGLTPK